MYFLGWEENEVTAEEDDDILDTLLVYASLVSGVNFQLYCLGCEQSEVTVEQDDDVLDTWFSSGIYPFAGRE